MNPVRHSVAALASACLLTACGGGETDTTAPSATALSSPSASSVSLEGCVQGAQQRSATVQAFGDDGRLIASATPDAQGVFLLRVPARQSVKLQLAPGSDAGLGLLTGSSNLSLSGCLNAGA